MFTESKKKLNWIVLEIILNRIKQKPTSSNEDNNNILEHIF